MNTNVKEKLKEAIQSFIKEEDGAGLIEYCLIAAVIGVGCIAAMTTLKNDITTEFNNIGTTLKAGGGK